MKNQRIISQRLELHNVEGKRLVEICKNVLNLNTIHKIEILDIFEFDEVSHQDFERIVGIFESDITKTSFKCTFLEKPHFHIEPTWGQFDMKLMRLENQVKVLMGIETKIRHSQVYICDNASEDDLEIFEKYIVNPFEFVTYDTQFVENDTASELLPVHGFIDFNKHELAIFSNQLVMDIDDLKHVQTYFKSINRNPKLIELKIIDTYWSDHCRHTTFNTHLSEINILDSRVMRSFEDYLNTRKEVYGEKQKPITLMDLATINAKDLYKKGKLDDWDRSKEVNAASINVEINVGGALENWLLLFKNETHNHPTEIEPYGGASTCFGGCVRDPLSGRGHVYQGMRISGSKNPLTSLEKTRNNKLMARKICTEAAEGYSDYANQMGINSGYLKEYYHDGFEAKRLELGALVAAVKKEHVYKTEPIPGDIILMLGGKTGRDGLGAAVGSSQMQTDSSLRFAGAEVQKGNPYIERKIVRLFNNPLASKLIKRCNDFGAGGVAVAIGELADGVYIDLDKVPCKYPMHGGEIALSESQERMAVVIAKEDVNEFLQYCEKEDVEASNVAYVTQEARVRMVYQGNEIVNIERSFLDTNGVEKKASVIVKPVPLLSEKEPISKETIIESISNIHTASLRGLREKFNTTIMNNNEENDLISQEGMVSLFPVKNTDAVSFMSCGYPLSLSEDSYAMGYYSVVEAVSKIVAMGGSPDKIRLSFQEYFERLNSSEQWGKPFAALLGAYTVMEAWDIPALGGKDSMSGTFEEISVPPSVLCFAVQHGVRQDVITRNLKTMGSYLTLIQPIKKESMINLEELQETYRKIYQDMQNGQMISPSTVTNSIFSSLFEMSLGSNYGVEIENDCDVLEAYWGGLIVESIEPLPYGTLIAKTTKEPSIQYQGVTFDKFKLQEKHEAVLETVYPVLQKTKSSLRDGVHSNIDFHKSQRQKQAVVLVMEGVFGEYDVINKLEQAGFNVMTHIIKFNAFKTSCDELSDILNETDLLIFPNGFIKEENSTVSGIEWKLLFENEGLNIAFKEYLNQGRQVLGLGTGALGVAHLGLVGNVSIQPIGNHYINTHVKVVSDHHPLSYKLLNNEYVIPLQTPYVFSKVESKNIILMQEEKFGESHQAVGIVNKNSIAILSSIDQINTEFFENLYQYTWEEIK